MLKLTVLTAAGLALGSLILAQTVRTDSEIDIATVSIGDEGQFALGVEVVVTIPESFEGDLGVLEVVISRLAQGDVRTPVHIYTAQILPFGPPTQTREKRILTAAIPAEFSSILADRSTDFVLEVRAATQNQDGSKQSTEFQVDSAQILTEASN